MGAYTTSAVVSTLASFCNSSFHVSSVFWQACPIRASGGSHPGPWLSGPWDWPGCPASAGGSRGARRRPGGPRAAQDGQGRGVGEARGISMWSRGRKHSGHSPKSPRGLVRSLRPGARAKGCQTQPTHFQLRTEIPFSPAISGSSRGNPSPFPLGSSPFSFLPPGGDREVGVGVGVGGAAPRARSARREAVAKRGGARG